MTEGSLTTASQGTRHSGSYLRTRIIIVSSLLILPLPASLQRCCCLPVLPFSPNPWATVTRSLALCSPFPASHYLTRSEVEGGIVQRAGHCWRPSATSRGADALAERGAVVAASGRSHEELALMSMHQHGSASLHLHLLHAGILEVCD